MGDVIKLHSAASRAVGHKSGRSSPRGTPVSRSISKTNSAGTPFLDFVSQYETSDCLVPMRSASDFWLPATSQARLSASVDMPPSNPNLGESQPKTLCEIDNLNFGSNGFMKALKADSPAFGRRVRERREEIDISQKELGEASGYSQQNIVTIEAGRVKRPERCAAALAKALRTSMDWLLWEKGPRKFGPQYHSRKKLVEKYEELPAEVKETISQAIDAATRSGVRKRKSD